MCCRVCIIQPLDEVLAALMAENALAGPVIALPHYNVAPGQAVPVLLASARPGGRRRLATLHWGLIPAWAKDPEIARHTANARIETIAEKPAFRQLVGKRHCLFPVSGYYEWQKQGRKKQPFLIRPSDPADGNFLLLAGLWDAWRPAHHPPRESFTVITRPAVSDLADIHDRMPAIVPHDDADAWLAGDRGPLSANFANLSRQAVSPHVNAAAHNDPRCLAPDDAGTGPELFA